MDRTFIKKGYERNQFLLFLLTMNHFFLKILNIENNILISLIY